MRRKKRLSERLEKVKDLLISPVKDILNVNEAIEDKRYIDFEKIFGNSFPVELEIGCGKGGFIAALASEEREKNFVAVEMLDNIIVSAAEEAKERELINVRFMNTAAEYLPRYIREGSVNAIYLNFSPPYPKAGYEARRLTSAGFVSAYKKFLRKGGKVYQRTDDKEFFLYSSEVFSEYGFEVEDTSEIKREILTEYERKFNSLGVPVYSLTATKKED